MPKRVRVTFTTRPECIEHINAKRGFMTVSEYIHRLIVRDYNEAHPDKKIRMWNPEEEES